MPTQPNPKRPKATDVRPFCAIGDPGPGFEALALQLSSIGFAISQRFRSSLAPLGIEPRQFALLRAVGFTGGQAQKSLADQLQVPTSSMVATIDDLEERGLLQRRPTPADRRVRALYLTKKGERLLEKVLPVAMETEMSIRDALGTKGSQQLADLLHEVGPLFGVEPGAAHSALTQGDS